MSFIDTLSNVKSVVLFAEFTGINLGKVKNVVDEGAKYAFAAYLYGHWQIKFVMQTLQISLTLRNVFNLQSLN